MMIRTKTKVMTTTMISKVKHHKLIRDLDIADYHAIPNTYSSSQFKDLLDDPDVFIKKYIEKSIPREESAAFDVGTYFHTGTLEPHKLKAECIVYPGKVRRGKDWEKFKVKHNGKAIVTQGQKESAEGLVRAVKNSPVAQNYLDGTAEVSLFVQILIVDGQIYAPHYGKMLTKDGWVQSTKEIDKKKMKNAFAFVVKVRADMLGDTYISDLKSTTGNARSERSMREKISYYCYDLSAALYLDIFSLVRPALTEFWWIFASKDFFNSRTHKASAKNILVGRAKYMWAFIQMADCAVCKWQTVDRPGILEPLPYELEWLEERDIDLL